MTPINQEQVNQTAQMLLVYLEDPKNVTPNNMLEGIVSGKSLLRGILSGSLVVCQNEDMQQTNKPNLPPQTIVDKKAAASV